MGSGARYGLLACLTAVLALGLVWDRLNPPSPASLAPRGDSAPRDTVRILIGGTPVPTAHPPTAVPGGAGGSDHGALPQQPPEPTVAIGARTHIVRSGDTLGGISQKYLGTSRRARELADANDLRIDSPLRIGQTLRLPELHPVDQESVRKPPPPVAKNIPAPPPEVTPGGTRSLPTVPAPPAGSASRTHTVVAGDNLSRIARKYYGGTDAVATLCDANGIRPGDILRPGQVLRLPAVRSAAQQAASE